ncbi:SoxR reducing system RseC family protein [Niveibacterium terrae]|uniref:SoxR reducing system RseC family protein n=1 Tax=Niveibacterium terrae TaxID=3373598 RepID=UPI003A8E1A75
MKTYRKARVVSVEGGEAIVAIDPLVGCGHCHEPGGCGGAAGDGLGLRRTEFRALNTLGAQPGDWVSVAVPDQGPRLAALLAYGLPALGLLAGASLASLAGLGDGGAALAAVSVALAAYVLGRALARLPALRSAMKVEVVEASLSQSRCGSSL